MNGREQIQNKLLVIRCQQGDSQAIDELIVFWKDRLWRHALRLSGFEEDTAWDILQESFMAMIGGISRLNDPAAFPSWVYRIVTNKARLWMRSESRRKKTLKRFIENETLQQPKPDNVSTDPLREAIRTLSAEDQAILGMRYEEEFSIAEIADILGVPPGTVKSRLFNARKRLKEIVEDKNHE